MKNLLKILPLLIIIGCTQKTEQLKDNSEVIDLEDESTTVDLKDSMVFTVREQRLMCNNHHYRNRTTTYIDSTTNEYTAAILLYDTKDTLLLKTINADSLFHTISKYKLFQDSMPIEELNDYRLVDVLPTSFIRGCNTYLYAKLCKPNAKNIYIGFAIKVFGDHRSKTGRLWISTFYKNDIPPFWK